ncbi:MAG: citrate transporter [Erysipelotrichaceae bacterium]|nr:citrate transporter [Erysipelotrichaceae bacterium]
MSKVKRAIFNFMKKEVVLSIAIICTIITIFFVPFDKSYLDYFEMKTLICLFCMLVVVAGLKNTNVFELISRKLIGLFRTRRAVIYALVFGTFFFDMIVANDMSLITFLPLTYVVLHSTNNDKYLGITFILQTIAANMGGMVTPYGNPQNLYLYSFYNIPVSEFFGVLLPQFCVIVFMLCIAGFFIKNEDLTLKNNNVIDVKKKELSIYCVLFVLVILSIFRVIPHYITLIIVVLTVLFSDIKRFKFVDYALLATFCVFFVFSGNIARIAVIQKFIAKIVAKNTLLAGIVSCQFISNVPTAIFLSKFTTNYSDLLVAVNIGSLGIIISSLASLITLKEFLKHQPKGFKKYMLTFTLVNTTFLIVLMGVTLLF